MVQEHHIEAVDFGFERTSKEAEFIACLVEYLGMCLIVGVVLHFVQLLGLCL